MTWVNVPAAPGDSLGGFQRRLMTNEALLQRCASIIGIKCGPAVDVDTVEAVVTAMQRRVRVAELELATVKGILAQRAAQEH